jgi:nucleoside-diphosphate-sugar epimerase
MQSDISYLKGADAIVFGGAGFIGHHLSSALVELGVASVVCADIVPPARPPARGVRFAPVDVREPIDLESGGSQPLVFNLAAVHRTPGHADSEYMETNVAGARNITAYCVRRGARSLWFTSSISVYGQSEDVKDEESPLKPTTAYGRSKAEAERIHREWAEAGAERHLVVARPAAVFGPGEGGNFVRLARALRQRRFLYPGRKDTRKACGYVTELIRTMLFMRSFASPAVTYNFAYPDTPTIETICRSLREVGGLPRPLGVMPLAPALAAARVLNALGASTFDPERVKKLVVSTNIEPKRLQRSGYEFRTTLSSALSDWHSSDPAGEFV